MNEKRNREMVRMHVEDRMTLTAISKVYGISRERARQLVRREGVSQSVSRGVTAIARRRPRKARKIAACETCGELFAFLPSSGRRGRFCSPACFYTSGSVFTSAALLSSLRELAAILGRTPNIRDMNSADGPSHMTYVNRFGSIRAAQERAGLEPNGVGNPGHIKAVEATP